MRILKVSILLLLICKSTLGLSISIDLNGGQSCCEVIMESADQNCSQDSEDTKNCCNTVCDCLCCGHIFTFHKVNELLVAEASVLNVKQAIFSFSYLHDFNNSIWQPPRPILEE